MDSHVISYNSGLTQESTHRYKFDISDAVQAWIDEDTTITARVDADTYTVCTVNVLAKRISLNYTSVDVDEGRWVTMTATTVPEGESVTWESSNPSISNSSVATVSYSGTVTGVGAGQTVITLWATLDNVQYSQSYTLICVKTVNVEVIYDQAYLYRYPDAVTRISNMMSILQDYYFSEFYVQVNFTAPQLFESYADSNCSSAPDEICSDCQDASCFYSTTLPDGTIMRSDYHHKGITNIAYRIPFPDTSKTFKIAFIGHVVCDYNNYCVNYDGEQSVFGIAYQGYGLALVADSRSDQDELVTLIHEFGHLFGVIDHYGYPYLSTEATNEGGYYSGVFAKECIYGEYKGVESIRANITICDGCRQLVLTNMGQIEHE